MSNYISINKKAYDTLSQEYKNRGIIKSEFEETPEYLIDNILTFLTENNNSTVLEVGPGSGEIVLCFENKGFRTIAVELSKNIARIVKERSPNTIIINSNILEVSFLSNQFDIIYAGALIHLFPEQDAIKVLKCFSKWLKTDGLLFINTTISDTSEEGFYNKPDYISSVKRFRRKWREEDFEVFVKKEFNIIKKLYTNEVDRGKVWVAYICKVH